jgi:hypothetical protein
VEKSSRRHAARSASRAVSWLLAAALLLSALPASADEYDPRRAGHPLRIIAYALHPVGVAFDYLLFRPAHWLGHQEPLRTIFGHRGKRYEDH